MRDWSAGDVLALPVATDVVTAGAIFKIGRTRCYEMARDGSFPVPVLKIGNEYRVPTAPILRLLGLVPETDVAGADTPASATTHDEIGARRDGSSYSRTT
jgi:hypothetical protein